MLYKRQNIGKKIILQFYIYTLENIQKIFVTAVIYDFTSSKHIYNVNRLSQILE